MSVSETLKRLRREARVEAERLGAAAEAENHPAKAARLLSLSGVFHRLADTVTREEEALYTDPATVRYMVSDARRNAIKYNTKSLEAEDQTKAEAASEDEIRAAASSAFAYYVRARLYEIEAERLQAMLEKAEGGV